MPYYRDSYQRLDEDKINSRLLGMGFKSVREKANPHHSGSFSLHETMQLEQLGCKFVEETIISGCSIKSPESSIPIESKQSEKTESELSKHQATVDVPKQKPGILRLPPVVLHPRLRTMSDYSRKPIINGLKRHRSEYLTTTSMRKEVLENGPDVIERRKPSILPTVRQGRF